MLGFVHAPSLNPGISAPALVSHKDQNRVSRLSTHRASIHTQFRYGTEMHTLYLALARAESKCGLHIRGTLAAGGETPREAEEEV